MKKLYFFLFCIFNCVAQNPADRDPTFNTFSLPLGSYFIDYDVLQTAVQEDGKILFLKAVSDAAGPKLLRLNNNILDNSFNTGTGFNSTISNFRLQPDGKILVIGYFTSYNGTSVKKIVRLNTDGSIDNTFALAAGVTVSTNYDSPPDVQLQADGKILISASFNSKSGIVRLNKDGSVDNTFTTINTIDLGVGIIRVQSDGKIISAGGTSTGKKIIRLNKDGSFDTDIIPYADKIDKLYDIAFQPDGKIMVLTVFIDSNNYISAKLTRMNVDGTVDAAFKANSLSYNSQAKDKMIVQSDGKIVVGGAFLVQGSSSYNLVRFNSDGTLDTTFKTGKGVEGYVNNLEALKNGKILVSGDFRRYNGETVNYACILNSDGTRDYSFSNRNVGFDTGLLNTATILPDDKIITTGSVNSYNGKSTSNVIRLNSDGSLDETLTFGGSSGFYGYGVNSIAAQNDGKLVVGGDFIGFNGINASKIVRMNADGTRDNSFVMGTGFDYEVIKVVVLPDNKILVGGNFTKYKGGTCVGLARLNSDGSLDTTFKATWKGMNDAAFPYVRDIKVLPDGKILLSSISFGANRGLTRLNSNGTEDTTFVLDAGVTTNGDDIYVQNDGKILLTFKKDNVNGFFRLSPNGSLDPSYKYTPIDSEYYVTFIAGMQKDDKILISGYSIQNNKNCFFCEIKFRRKL